MSSVEKKTYASLLCEETMMNGEYNKNSNRVHPDLLQTQKGPPKGCCSTKMSWSTFFFVIVSITIVLDAQYRLGMVYFGALLIVVPLFLRLAQVLALKPNKVPPTLDGERIFGEIIHSFWVPVGEQSKAALCYFIVQYTFEGVTYQRKYLDNTWGLISTATYVELIVNKTNPKEPLSALSVEYLSRHHHDTGTTTGPLKECFSWVITIVLYMFLTLPFFAIPFDCNAFFLDCTPTLWMDAILHYILIMGLIPLLPYLNHDERKTWQTTRAAIAMNIVDNPFSSLNPYCENDTMTICPATFAAVALKKAEKPFVPQAGDKAVDQSLYGLAPASRGTHLYLASGSVSFMVWMLYASLELGIPFIFYFYMVWLTLWLAYDWVSIITDYVYLEPIQTKYQKEGVLPKNVEVLKSGEQDTNLTSIIQYDVDVTNSDGYTKTVTAHARIKTGDEHKLLILPSEPSTAFVAEAPPPKSWLTIVKLVVSPVGLISFYTWKEDAGLLEKCLFAAITGSLFVICFFCYAMVTVSIEHNPLAGKRGNTVVFVKG